MRVSLIYITFFFYGFSWAATFNNELIIVEDSAKVGEPITAKLTVTHNRSEVVYFPDSTFDFGVYTFLSKSWTPTTVSDTGITDYAIYKLTTFELDSVQKLKIPVYRIIKGDSVEVFSNIDSFAIKYELTKFPEKIELKENTTFARPQLPISEIVTAGVLLLMVIALIIVWIAFGRNIVAKIKTVVMKHRLKKFEEQFDTIFQNAKTNPKHVNKLVKVWKSIINQLQNSHSLP